MKVVEANRHTPVCQDTVRKPASAERSRDWSNRVWKAERAGRDPCQCAVISRWVVDGVPMCASHAGQHALRFLAKN